MQNQPADIGQQQQLVPVRLVPYEQSSMDRVKDWLRRTDHFLGRVLGKIHQEFGYDPVFTFFAFVAVLIGWMLVEPKDAPILSQIICCCTYPLSESIAALAERDEDGLRIWCVYWIGYDWLGHFDVLQDLTLAYWPAKTILFAYLFLPPTQYISIIYDAWFMPILELIFGELRIETLRWAHPFVLRSMGLNREVVNSWNQEQLRAYLEHCKGAFFLLLARLHALLADVQPAPPPGPAEPAMAEPPLD